MKTTTNIGLKKPDYTDPVDIAIINSNMDTLDTQIQSVKKQVEEIDVSWDGISGKPSTFPPSTHTHTDLTALVDRGYLTSKTLTDKTDLNTVIENGTYVFNAFGQYTNAPSIDTYGYIVGNMVVYTGNGCVTQIIYPGYNGEVILFRKKNNSSGWSAWKEIATTSSTVANADTVDGLHGNLLARLDTIPTFSGGVNGPEGGEIRLAKPQSSTNLTTDVVIDIHGNNLRFFENGNGYKGAFINLSKVGNVDSSEIALTSSTVANADTVDGKHASDFLSTSGGTVNGDIMLNGIRALKWICGRPNYSSIFWNASTQNNFGVTHRVDGIDVLNVNTDQISMMRPLVVGSNITASGQFIHPGGNAFRIAATPYGFFIRNDGQNTYFMLTNSGDPYGGYNDLRPMSIANSTGNVSFGHGVGISGQLSVGNSNGNVKRTTISTASPSGGVNGDVWIMYS